MTSTIFNNCKRRIADNRMNTVTPDKRSRTEPDDGAQYLCNKINKSKSFWSCKYEQHCPNPAIWCYSESNVEPHVCDQHRQPYHKFHWDTVRILLFADLYDFGFDDKCEHRCKYMPGCLRTARWVDNPRAEFPMACDGCKQASQCFSWHACNNIHPPPPGRDSPEPEPNNKKAK